MARDMKGMKSTDFVEMINFINKYHAFALWLSDTEKAEAQKLYPNLDEYGFNIKYVDSCYDSRFKDVWSVSFRGMGRKVIFHTNNNLELPYDTLFDWVMAYLKKEWNPTEEQYKSIRTSESQDKIDLSRELRNNDIKKMALEKYPVLKIENTECIKFGDFNYAKRAGFIEGLHHALELIKTPKENKK